VIRNLNCTARFDPLAETDKALRKDPNMTALPQTFRQLVFVAGASLSAFVMISASTASAQQAPYFRAELAKPVEKTATVIQGVVWQCEGTVCAASKATSRPINVCARLVRKLGEVTSFTVRDEPMAGDELANCNGAD